MDIKFKPAITIEVVVKAPIEKVWQYFTDPKHIVQWSFASDDWHTPYADNDLRTGGKFKSTMAAKDGSFSFDFEGKYSNVQKHQVIAYGLEDGRQVKTVFAANGNETKVTQTFDPENENDVEMQRGGWQAILNNFKKHTEAN